VIVGIAHTVSGRGAFAVYSEPPEAPAEVRRASRTMRRIPFVGGRALHRQEAGDLLVRQDQVSLITRTSAGCA
jgi:hypothetical protein